MYLPPLNCDANDKENASRVGKMTAAIKKRIEKIQKDVPVTTVDWNHQTVRDEKKYISTT